MSDDVEAAEQQGADIGPGDIAIVGMSGRFPGAPSVGALWANLLAGTEGITRYTDDELRACGVPESLIADPAYVKAGAVVDGIEDFDAEFFGVLPAEARILDPQQRLFLEHSWGALEDAGCVPATFDGAVGVFGGSAWSTYLTQNLARRADLVETMGETAIGLANEKDSLTTRVAHTLGLTGPTYSVQSFCSTSLVAVAAAASSLAAEECDLALAGGVSIAVPHRVGYLHQDGGMTSPDGSCRAFDAAAQGTPVGSGVGVVALRRLADALAAGDRVYAVIRGWAVNNDGGRKVGFTAPGVQGQTDVVLEALASAGLEPADIDYVETHGTGTALGDAAELAALQQVFRGESCLLGSVKTNVGHLDRAAGVTGLIKAALAMYHGVLPATLHFTRPNTQMETGDADLTVVGEQREWSRSERVRRAGVSAFGIGGTNAHVVLQEPPVAVPAAPTTRRHEVLVWSGRSAAAADATTATLAEHLATASPADTAYTLQTGRRVFEHRRAAVLPAAGAPLRATGVEEVRTDRPVAWILAPVPGAAAEVLLATEPAFREIVESCGTPLDPTVGAYALGRLLQSWGVRPSVLAGDELVAAALAGVLPVAAAAAIARGETVPGLAGMLRAPEVPVVSAVTGAPLDEARATDPGYWAPDDHARTTALPAGLDGDPAVLEVGFDDVSLSAGRPADLLLAERLADLWLAGVPLDWEAYQHGRGLVRAGAPGYSFQRRRFWVDAPGEAPAPPQAAPQPVVQPVGQPVTPHPDGGEGPEVLLVRWRPEPLRAAASAAASPAGAPGVQVRLPDGPDHRTRVLELVAAHPGAQLTIGLLGATALGFARLVDAVADVTAAEVRVVAVTGAGSSAQDRAAMGPLCLVARQENPGLLCRAVDTDTDIHTDTDTDTDPDGLLGVELAADEPAPQVRYRAGQRLVAEYRAAGETAALPSPVRAGGRYLITGGLGDVGLLLAVHLADRGAGALVLTGRRGPVAGTAAASAVAGLRQRGVEVLTPAVDVTDRTAMAALFAGCPIDGVFHAAAESDLALLRPVRELTPDLLDRHFAAKVGGARVLADVFAGLADAPEFCLVFSSISTVLGGLGFGAYAAANAVLDDIAVTTAGPTRWMSAGWDTWAPTLHRWQDGTGAAMAEHAMSAPDALAALDRVLAAGRSSSLVVVGDLDARLRTWTSPPDLRAAEATTGERAPRPDLAQPYLPPRTATERELAGLWSDLLGIAPIGTADNFFDLGGSSLLGLQLVAVLRKRLGRSVPTVVLFAAPTIRALADLFDDRPAPAPMPAPIPAPVPAPIPAAASVTAPATVREPARESAGTGADPSGRVAIVGMAGRFPGAADVGAFWRNLVEGRESIRFFDHDELREAGVDPRLLADPDYVAARPVLDDVKGFDAGFFGYSPRAATFTDPQQRLFLEVCWEALEQGGYGAADGRGRVGVFGGTNISTYLLQAHDRMRDDENLNDYELVMGNDKDALTTTVSYALDLRGPSIAVQTFCSTSLVAVHLACQSLRNGECEMAIAGGVSIRVPDRVGHLYQPGGMASPDGHVRTFDADARGSMFGDGAAVVLLKPLEAAVRDGDTIWAVVRGTAINNDGALKVGYTAPSVVGQAQVVSDALAAAGVQPSQVGYVEAHGTGTELGDPIEVAALTRAFGPDAGTGYCPIGSVKPNVGHLDRAAGVTGLIKTALALRTGVIPPTLHYERPNPEIDFESSPFYVNAELTPWPSTPDRPRIAGVNSLGMGGTNVHVVLEEPPGAHGGPGPVRRHQIVPLSARSEAAADAAVANLAGAVADQALADVAYTLQVGRTTFGHRRVTVARDTAGLVGALTGARDASPLLRRADPMQGRRTAFVFAGVGEQYPGLVTELYQREPVFRRHLDDCGPALGRDLMELLTGERIAAKAEGLFGRASAPTDARSLTLRRTEMAQPAVFAAEYALASTMIDWGIEPEIMLGYSLGEYVAACLAGVLSLRDALALVTFRAELIGRQPAGSMLAVSLSADELVRRVGPLAPQGVDLAVQNGAQNVVVAGSPDAVGRLAAKLATADVACRELATTHAFHSRALNPLRADLTSWVERNVTLHAPQRPYVSDVTGQLADAALVCDPGYWARHMCETVQFADGVATVLADPEIAVVEIGPGQSLGAMIRGQGCPRERWPLIVATLPGSSDRRADDEVFADALARLWLTGVDVDWNAHHGENRPGRVPLPTYPFERQEYWISDDRATRRTVGGERSAVLAEDATLFETVSALPRLPEAGWLHLPVWHQTSAPAAGGPGPGPWLVFSSGDAADTAVVEALRATGAEVDLVEPGEAFTSSDAGAYRIAPGSLPDTAALLTALRRRDRLPARVLHLWTRSRSEIEPGLHTLTALARTAREIGLDTWTLDVVTTATQQVLPGDVPDPRRATVTGPVRVIPLEYPTVTTRLVDVDGSTPARRIVAELLAAPTEQVVALRGRGRWAPAFATLPDPAPVASTFRDGGVYLITGGLGGIGLGMAENLARDHRARLVLFGRTGLSPQDTRRTEAVRRLVELGAEVEIVTGDVTDEADVRRAVATAVDRFGGLHGVIHGAGVPAIGLMQFKDPAELDAVLAPKVAGTSNLAAATRDLDVDVVVLFSSITSMTGGGPGQVDYCAANAYLDAYAQREFGTGRRVVSVGWGEWTWNAWERGLDGYDPSLQEFFRTNRARFGITFDEGWRALQRVLATDEPRVVVSTQDFTTVSRLSRDFTVDLVRGPVSGTPAGPRHERPDLATAYLAPRTPVQETIAALWADVLKLDRVGVADSFFELGGNSLIGVDVVGKLRGEFGLDTLAPHTLYEAPTVEALAALIEAATDAGGGGSTAPPERPDRRLRAELRRTGLREGAAQRRRNTR